jgi:hypothetical protein
MAGAVRQPIDIPSLERYLDEHVPIIKTPIDVKQVSRRYLFVNYSVNKLILYSLASDNPILPT